MYKVVMSLMVSIFFAGCALPWFGQPYNNTVGQLQETYWSEYHVTTCNKNPWGEDTAEVVQNYYATQYAITITDAQFGELTGDMERCTECGCPTGTVLRVSTNLSNRIRLAELGFVTDSTAIADYSAVEPAVVLEDSVLEDSLLQNTNVINDAIVKTNTNSDSAISTKNNNKDNDTKDDVIKKEVPKINEGITTTTQDTDAAETEPTPEDLTLTATVERIQSALANYHAEHKNYPASLAELSADFGDTTAINYTPIGTTPANYYDLTADFSTGKVTFNP